MARRWKFTVIIAAAFLAAGATAASLMVPGTDQEARIYALEPAGPGPLDGMTFTGQMGPEGKVMDVSDTFVFEDGTFVSKECKSRCDYPARPYRAKKTENGWTFTSITRCPSKDATIVWKGTVRDGTISGVATWTLRRWYWTLQRDFAFEAELQGEPTQNALAN